LNSGMYNALRGCLVQEFRLKTISNNLANAGTTGFKKDELSFDQWLQVHQQTNMEQGSLRHTENMLDMALSGDGFFKVSTGAGTRYTRNGTFQIDFEGRLVTSEGDPVMGQSGPIVVDGGNVTVDAIGGVSVDGRKWTSWPLLHLIKPNKLKRITPLTMFTLEKERNVNPRI